MTRPINGSLTVASFDATGIPGEYTFTGAIYNNQADATGNGAADIQPGFVIFVPSSDPNSFSPLAGVVHRYKITSVTVIDPQTFDGTMLWDEPGEEQEAVTNGVACIVAQVTPGLLLADLPSDVVYAELQSGLAFQSFQVDKRNILDTLSATGGGGGGTGLTLTQEIVPYGATGIDGSALWHTPANPVFVILWINGIRYWYNNDFTLTGNIINWTNSVFSPSQFDNVIAEYSY